MRRGEKERKKERKKESEKNKQINEVRVRWRSNKEEK